MKVLLVNPYWPYPYGKGEHTYNRIWPPLSLANCAAVLEKGGHEVKILDAHALRIRPGRTAGYVKGYDKVFITSSSLDRWQCPNNDITSFLETVRHVREITGEIYLMGYHGTADPAGLLRRTDCRAVIRGEPEHIVREICDGTDLSAVRGVTFKENGAVVWNPDGESVDIAGLPLPAFKLLDFKKYSYEIMGGDFSLFETGRGCPHNCFFCSKIMYGRNIRHKPLRQVSEEISFAVERCGVKNGYFIDLEFLSNPGLVNGICDFLISKRYNFNWCCQTRPDSLDREVLGRMKAAGCVLVHIGVESGTQKYLDLSGKRIKLEKVVRAVKLCEEAGIKTLAFYLFGFKGETAEDREEIFRFAKKLNADFISFHKIFPYTNRDIYMPSARTDKALDGFIRGKYLRYYLRASYLRKLNFSAAVRCLKLFWGRMTSLS